MLKKEIAWGSLALRDLKSVIINFLILITDEEKRIDYWCRRKRFS